MSTLSSLFLGDASEFQNLAGRLFTIYTKKDAILRGWGKMQSVMVSGCSVSLEMYNCIKYLT